MKKQLMMSDVDLIYTKKEHTPAVQIRQSSDAVAPAREAIGAAQLNLREFFGILLVNRANFIVKRSIISIGGMNTTVVDPKIVFMTTLLSGAGGFVLFHNHPSGCPKPSQADIQMTKRLSDAAAIMDISLLDHIIVTDKDYFSFADDGLL